MGTAGSMKGDTKRKANVPKMTVMDLVNTLEEIVGTLEYEHVDHSLVLQVFKQVCVHGMCDNVLFSTHGHTSPLLPTCDSVPVPMLIHLP